MLESLGIMLSLPDSTEQNYNLSRKTKTDLHEIITSIWGLVLVYKLPFLECLPSEFTSLNALYLLWNRAPQIGTWTHVTGTRTPPKPWLGLEPTRTGLEPSQNPDWDLNPHSWDSNPAKTLTRTWTHTAGTRTWPKSTVFQLRSHTWFQDLMKLRFLMSHCRKDSVRDKVIGKKWIYLERNTLYRQSMGHLRRWERHPGMGLSVFIGVGNFIG